MLYSECENDPPAGGELFAYANMLKVRLPDQSGSLVSALRFYSVLCIGYKCKLLFTSTRRSPDMVYPVGFFYPTGVILPYGVNLRVENTSDKH